MPLPGYRLATGLTDVYQIDKIGGGGIDGGGGVSSGTTLPTDQTEGSFYIFNGPAGTPSRLFVRFAEGWAGLLMPDDFGN